MESEKKRGGILGSAAVIGLIILVSKLLGLFRDILVAGAYGTTSAATAYEAASTLPVTIFDLVIGGVVTSAFIPVFNTVLVKRGKKDAMSFANSYVNFILMICTVIALIGMIFSDGLVHLMAPKLDAETADLASYLMRIMFPMIIFTGLAFSYVGILQSMGEFNLPAVISLVSNSIMVGYLFTLNRFFGIVGLAVAMLLGWASQAAIQIPKAHSLGFRYKPRIKVFDADMKCAVKAALPILIGTWTTPLCNLINKSFASGIDNGSGMTSIGYANRLYIMIVGVFSFVATNLLFPYFSRAEAEGDRDGAEKMIKTSVKTLVYIIAPIAVGLMILSEPFTAVMFERGEFTSEDTVRTAAALAGYSVGMIFMAANEVIVKALFAANRPRITMVSSLVSMGANILVVALFSERLGVGGIALVSAGATVFNMAINMTMARRRGVCRFGLRDSLDALRSVVSACAMIPVIIPLSSLFDAPIAKLGASVAAAVPVYLIVSIILRSEEAKFITDAVKSKIKK